MLSFSVSGLSARSAVFIIALIMTACTIAPQRPSQRSGQSAEPDSAMLAMVEMNQQLAEAADRELLSYMRNHPGRWFEQEDGSWCEPDTIPLNYAYSPTRPIRLHLITRDLNGNLLSDVQGEYQLGKCQLPQAVENYITIHYPQSTIHFKVLAPYYVAYGSRGMETIPPYTNVMIEVKVQ